MKEHRRLRLQARAGRIILAAVVLSAAAAVVWYRSLPREEGRTTPPALPAADGRAEMVTRDFRHAETRMDRTVWVLEAERAEVTGDAARLHAVKITWYGEPGDVPVVVTSRAGRVNLRTQNAVLLGAVRLERADGSALETERLSWNGARRTLRAPRPVRITTRSFTFQGGNMVANVGKQRVKIGGAVQGDILAGAATFGGRS